MIVNSVDILKYVSKYLKISPGYMALSSNALPTRANNNVTVKGFLNIIFDLMKESNFPLSNNGKDIAQLKQWLQYCIVYVIHQDTQNNINQILQELNELLATKTYLVSYNLSIADVVLYYILYNVMEGLSLMEKEKYFNVSRWFDNIQQNNDVRQSNKLVNFNTNYLTALIPANV